MATFSSNGITVEYNDNSEEVLAALRNAVELNDALVNRSTENNISEEAFMSEDEFLAELFADMNLGETTETVAAMKEWLIGKGYEI